MATDISQASSVFIRPDGKEKVTGSGRYTADLTLTGRLRALPLRRSPARPHPADRHVRRRARFPGVLAVLTHEDVPDVQYGAMVQDRYLFAKDVVRFEGEIVAGVAATSEEIAAAARRLIEVDYEPLPAITDFEAAMADGAPLVHDDWASNERDENLVADGNTLATPRS